MTALIIQIVIGRINVITMHHVSDKKTVWDHEWPSEPSHNIDRYG